MRHDAAMVLEHALLDVIPGREAEFEETFAVAKGLIAASPGFRSLRLSRGLETPNRYLLLVEWDTLEGSGGPTPTASGGRSSTTSTTRPPWSSTSASSPLRDRQGAGCAPRLARLVLVSPSLGVVRVSPFAELTNVQLGEFCHR
jgi:hypothetical protein